MNCSETQGASCHGLWGMSWLVNLFLMCLASFIHFQPSLMIPQRGHSSLLLKSARGFFFPMTHKSFLMNSEILHGQILEYLKKALCHSGQNVCFGVPGLQVQILVAPFSCLLDLDKEPFCASLSIKYGYK